jgi:hypothetical protein
MTSAGTSPDDQAGAAVDAEITDIQRRTETRAVNKRAMDAIDNMRELTLRMNKALDVLERTVSLTKEQEHKK